jgi:DNA mismatch repair ATPase MutS
MGGKSTILKSVGLICIMAQIGCYVPAQCMEATLFDSVFCRSGASDKIFSGKSTFMVEMNEAYEIISKASSRSLVLIDELGRGTSTSDGYSIACSVIHRLTSVNQCACLFVTHFSSLCNEFERIFPVTAVNYHMSFDFKEFIPLFKLKPGICPSSFGIIVAKKAGIPESILKAAHVKSLERWIRFYLK